ncbi:MAG: hypothetical protein HQL10_01485 [Nitrospirae bacterium]|nr:hypothetical protein [Nitrospirota bacterium]
MSKKSQLSPTNEAQASRFFKRDRLFRKLDNARKKPLIWITGPAGSGKTAIISGYIEARKLRAFWCRADFIAAYEGIPDIKSSDEPCVLIFDNYHDLPYSSNFHHDLKSSLSKLQQGVNVIFLSRHEPHPVLLDDVTKHGNRIGWDELRLTYDETKEFLSACNGFEEKDILRLYQKTEGWIMGLIAYSENRDKNDLPHPNTDAFYPADIKNAFEAMLDKLDSSSCEFLLKTSIFRSITTLMAERLTMNPHAEQILSGLYRKSFFIERKDSEYSYQPLFREFLLCRAQKESSGSEWIEICLRAAGILFEAGREPEAGDILIEHSLWDGLADLIIKAAPKLAANGHITAVSEWTAVLPESYFGLNPRLLYWKGLSSPDDNGAEALQKYLELCSVSNNNDGMLLSFAALSDRYIASSEFGHAENLISLVEPTMRNDASCSASKYFDDAVMNLFVLMSLSSPGHPDISFWEDKAFISVLAGHKTDINRRLISGINLCRYYLWMGDFSKAAFIRSFLVDNIRPEQVSEKIIGLFDELEVFYDLFAGAASASLKKSLGFLKEPANKKNIRILMHGLAASIEEDDNVSFDRIYQQLSLLINDAKESELAYYHYLLACREQMNRDNDRAFYNQELALKLLAKSGLSLEQPLFFIKMAEIQYERGSLSELEHYLSLARDAALKIKSLFFKHLSEFLELQILMDRGAASLNDSLNKAMLGMRAQNFFGIIWFNRSFTTRVCMKALQAGIEKDSALDVIRKRRLMPDTPPLDVEEWPYPIMIYTLGRFDLIKDSRPFKASGRLQSKPMIMLKALIAFGGVDVSKSQIVDALWPEVEGDAANTSFESTLYRLRRLIDDYKGIQLCDGQLSLDPCYYWVDSWAFEHMVGKADAAWQFSKSAGHKDRDVLREALSFSEKVVSMYKGAFLPADSDNAWAISKRESLRSKFVHSAAKAGEYWISDGKWKMAADWFQRCLDIDESSELFYQRLITCYKNLGLNIEADKLSDRITPVFHV